MGVIIIVIKLHSTWDYYFVITKEPTVSFLKPDLLVFGQFEFNEWFGAKFPVFSYYFTWRAPNLYKDRLWFILKNVTKNLFGLPLFLIVYTI